MQYKFSELTNIKELESLIKNFCAITGISCFIREIGSETSDYPIVDKNIYGEFYSFSPFIKSEFEKASENIIEKIKLGKKYYIFRCNSGVIYVGIPIVVDNVYIATIFTGQVFFKEPSMKLIRNKAKKLNINDEEYIKMVKNIPLIPRKKIRFFINFMINFGKTISEVCYAHIKEQETNKRLSGSYIELNGVYQQLRAAEQQLREQYDELQRVAYYDSLTNLPNCNFIEKKFNAYINKFKRLGIILIDLDNFKNINNTFGHQFGDKLLQKVGDKLKLLLRNDCVVSRTGDDEFLIIKKETESKQEVIKIIEDILNGLNRMWTLEDKEFFLSVSIGAAIYPQDGNDYTRIFRNVDIAMNKAKHLRKNSYVFFEKNMYDEILRKTELEKELRNAITNNELMVYYQPQIDVKTGKIVSLEALLRWNNKKLGWISPLEFIKLAEETGLIVPIGEWVLKNVCLQHSKWKKTGYSYDFIAVNVSVIQLQNSNFLHSVKKILSETGIKSHFLEFEITESVMMQTLESNLKVLNELKAMNIRIALDDFGTGYSSLNYLKCLPIDTLKLDKSFIDGLCKSSYEELITHEMIKLAHKMNLDVTAEGVELEEQLVSLKKKECNRIQGYYFSRPFPSDKIETILKKGTFDTNSAKIQS